MDALRAFRWIALIEGISFLVLLFIAMPLKYLFDMPLAVRITGGAHGLLFLLFCGALFRVVLERHWPVKRWALAFLSSLVPFGTFALDRALVREIAQLRQTDAPSS
jgi:integral membrane protein